MVRWSQHIETDVQEERSPISRILARRQRRSPSDAAEIVITRQRELSATSWGELLAQARSFGLGLCALGVQRGEAVGILAPSGPESEIVILGALLVGACVADLGDGTDSQLSVEILRRAKCRIAICGEREHAEALVVAVRQQCGERGLVGWGAASCVNGVVPFGQVCLKGSELAEREPVRVAEVIARVELNDWALVLPDSRRDGSFRQVHLSHDNCIVAAESLRKSIGIMATDRIAPLGRSRGLVELVLLTLLSALTGASMVHDAGEHSPLVLSQTARITVGIADGDILDVLHRELERELLIGAAWRRRVGHWAHRVGNEAARRRISGTDLGPFLALSHLIADRLVLSEQRRLLGGHLRRIVVYADGMRRSTRWFFESIGISPLGFLGIAESGGIGLLELPDEPRPGSYGRGMPGVDIWVNAEGKIRIRGANVSPAALGVDDRGWLDLGITGEIDEEGTIWPERDLGSLDAPSLAMLPIADQAEPKEK
jgi:long-chain acyl-CoA synthetase